MSANAFFQFAIFLGVLFLLAKPLGEYMGRVLDQEHTFLDPVLKPVERGLYRLAGIAPDARIQLILIAFAFGAFLEGVAGFGAPVAITAAILIQLGFRPGPEFTGILRAVEDLTLERKLKTKDEALEYVVRNFVK